MCPWFSPQPPPASAARFSASTCSSSLLPSRPTPASSSTTSPSLPAAIRRFTLDTNRQLHRIDSATLRLHGQRLDTGAQALRDALNDSDPIDPLPREVILELTTRRSTRPIFAPAGNLSIHRDDLDLDS